MNPEIQYPELIKMKDSEVFIEWAYLTREFTYTKVFIRRIIPKKELGVFIKALKLIHDIKFDPDNNRHEFVDTVTIEK